MLGLNLGVRYWAGAGDKIEAGAGVWVRHGAVQALFGVKVGRSLSLVVIMIVLVMGGDGNDVLSISSLRQLLSPTKDCLGFVVLPYKEIICNGSTPVMPVHVRELCSLYYW